MIKVINENDEGYFEGMVNAYLKDGWKLLDVNCGFLQSENYDFVTSFQAIVFKKVTND